MKFAINYSPQAAQLFKRQQIQLDYFKCPDWPNLIQEAKTLAPVTVHFEIITGSGTLSDKDWTLVDRLRADTNTNFVNLHLAALIKDYPDLQLNPTEPGDINRVIDGMLKDVWSMVNRFGGEHVIAENVPYRGTPDHNIMHPSGDPRVIKRIVEETGCGLLLDISHARMAAHYLGMDEVDYLNQLPTKQLRELHFAGVHNIDGKLRDHLPALPEDWRVLELVLGRISAGIWAKPWLLALEYGGIGEIFEWRSDPAVIQEQAPLIYKLVHAIAD